MLLLADIGICALGTLLATISMNTRSRDLLLPILLPAADRARYSSPRPAQRRSSSQKASGFGSVLARLLFLLGFDAIFLVVAWGTYDFAIGE